MNKLTVKEILELNSDKLEIMMTNEEFERMLALGFEYTWQLLEVLQESARLSGQYEDEKHVSISEYLDFLEEKEIYKE